MTVKITPKKYTFTQEQLNAHDKEVAEQAYRIAAVNTINKFTVLVDYPIGVAMKKLHKYALYLIKTYNLMSKNKEEFPQRKRLSVVSKSGGLPDNQEGG